MTKQKLSAENKRQCPINTSSGATQRKRKQLHRFGLVLKQEIKKKDTIKELIHLFYSCIQDIFIAPLQIQYYSEALLTQHGYWFRVSQRSVTGSCEWRTCPVPTWRPEPDSKPRAFGRKATNLPKSHQCSLATSLPDACTAYRLFLTSPVTVATAERSFSKFRLIKSYRRRTMFQDRIPIYIV